MAPDSSQKETEQQKQTIVRDFWKNFTKANPSLSIPLGDDGLPRNDSATIEAAYQAVFNTRNTGALNTPALARAYLRSIMPKGDTIQLNGAHFYLASLLSLQHSTATTTDGKPHYTGKCPFAQTIFTTNFDPILQISLQLFNVLYYMTDMPGGLPPDIFNGIDDTSLHLFYAHGSFYRAFQANSTGDIEKIRKKNADIIRPELKKRGVIVLGHSGWNDCLISALSDIETFDGNPYWLARDETRISQATRNILDTCSNAYFVQITDANNWMAKLHRHLCPGMPFTRLLQEPIPLLREQIKEINLQDITRSKDESEATASSAKEPSVNTIPPDSILPENFKKTPSSNSTKPKSPLTNPKRSLP
ncbi:hypothetical protein [Geminisphaera colitermitum]|uniref:hypothetical protein n=1 Tax=Geminisphaera colitermitum TaxID=1148786 RepID=UPI000158D93B|nr:hypothetical protein [Geminisphaera colitermitum]